MADRGSGGTTGGGDITTGGIGITGLPGGRRTDRLILHLSNMLWGGEPRGYPALWLLPAYGFFSSDLFGVSAEVEATVTLALVVPMRPV